MQDDCDTQEVEKDVSRTRASLDKAVPGKARTDSAPWWDGRQVAIRPDVPGSAFDPGDLILIKNDTERVEAEIRVEESVTETKASSLEDPWPHWLWEADEDPPGESSASSGPPEDA